MKQRWISIMISFTLVVGLFFLGPAHKALAADCSNSTTTLYRSATSGNWYSPAIWECSDDGVSWQVPTTDYPTASNGIITIRNGHAVSIAPMGPGINVNDLIVESGGSLTINLSSYPFNLIDNPSAAYELDDFGMVDVKGNLNIGASVYWRANAGSTFIKESQVGSPAHTIAARATFDPASTMIYKGNSGDDTAIGVAGITFGNLRFESKNGTAWVADSPTDQGMTVKGDFYVGPNVTYETYQYLSPLNFEGNFTINGILLNVDPAKTTNYLFKGTGKTIDGSGTIEFENFKVNSGASINLQRNITILSGYGAFITGTLNTGINLVAGGGNFSLASGGTLGIGSGQGISSTGSTGNIQVTGTRSFSSGANYVYNGSGAQQSGSGLPSTVNSLTIAATSESYLETPINIGSSTLVNGSLNLGTNIISGPGTFTLASGGTLNIGSPQGIMASGLEGNIQVSGSRNYSSGANYIYSSIENQTTGDGLPATVNNLTINSPLKKVSLNHPITVNGNLNVSKGAGFDLSSLSITVIGDFTNNGTISQTMTVDNTTANLLALSDGGGNMKYLGVDIQTPNNLGSVTVGIRSLGTGEFCTKDGGTSPAYVKRCYTIKPQFPNQSATVTLWALESELNGLLPANLTPYRYVAPNFMALTNVTPGSYGANYYSATGETAGFSHFLLGGPDAPTVVHLTSFSARNTKPISIMLISIAIITALLGAGLAVYRRRRI